MRVELLTVSRAADAPPQPAHRRGARARRLGRRDGDLVQPGLPRAHAAEGPDAAAARRRCAPGAGSSSPCASTRCWRRRGRGSTRAASSPSTTPSRTLSTRVLRELVEQHLPRTDAIADPLPVGLRVARRLPLRRDAIAVAARAARRPRTRASRATAWPTRSCCCCRSRSPSGAPARRAAEPLGRPGELLERYHASLPFTLTTGQKRSVRDIDRDLARAAGRCGGCCSATSARARRSSPCTRCCARAERGGQAALLAPTEVLVQQHAATVRTLVEPLGIEVAVVTGDLPAAERRARLQRIASGDAALVVGTHALLETSVEFAHLRVIVVDEQHRFGVEQRAALSEGHGAHALHMTATPIPRSLALSLYGDLDLTELRELPAGRQPIITRRGARGEARRLPRAGSSRSGTSTGARPTSSAPLVEGSETVAGARGRGAARRARQGARAAQRRPRARRARRPPSAPRRCARSPPREVHVLVATTVIEVGIDVPNATAMVIEDADRFGLSQLHQLRGRVGRGSDAVVLLPVRVARADASSGSGACRRCASTRAASSWPRSTCACAARASCRACASAGASDLRHASLHRHRAPDRALARRRALPGARAGRSTRVLAQAARERFGALVERIGRA